MDTQKKIEQIKAKIELMKERQFPQKQICKVEDELNQIEQQLEELEFFNGVYGDA